jgi:hypothetical protein
MRNLFVFLEINIYINCEINTTICKTYINIKLIINFILI